MLKYYFFGGGGGQNLQYPHILLKTKICNFSLKMPIFSFLPTYVGSYIYIETKVWNQCLYH